MRSSSNIITLAFLQALLTADAGPMGKAGYRRREKGRKLSTKAMEVGDLYVDIKGKSGAIEVTRSNVGKKKDKKSSVSIKLDALREVDSAGETVGKTGSPKHSINSFSSQDFVFGVDQIDVPIVIDSPSNSTDNTTEIPDDDAATGAQITFDTTLDTGSKLAVELILVSGAGEVGTTTEKWSVQPGDMKFNFNMTEWEWCDPCSDGTGAFIDFDIEIKGKNSSPKPKGSNKTYTLGDGALLDLSDQVLLDGEWTTMPEGYPKMENKGGKFLYTLRIPKFSDDAVYDPIVSFDPDFDSVGRMFIGASSLLSLLVAYFLL